MSVVRLLMASCLTSFAVSCAAEHGVSQPGTGDVGVFLAFGPYQVSSAHYLLTNGMSSYEGHLQIDGRDTLAMDFSVVAAGKYDLLVTADAPDGSFRCTGHAGPLVVTMDARVGVAIGFQCVGPTNRREHAPDDSWSFNECPDIFSVVADPPIGCSIQLHVDATDPDHKPQPLSFVWTNGMTAPNPALDCQAEGPVSLGVTVSDGDTAAACAASSALTVICPPGCDGSHTLADSGGTDGGTDSNYVDGAPRTDAAIGIAAADAQRE